MRRPDAELSSPSQSGAPPDAAPNGAEPTRFTRYRAAATGAVNRATAPLLGHARSWRAWRATFSSLREPQYRRYFWANFVSVGGSWMQRLGQDWLVLELTGSAVALGVTLAMQFLPILLGAVWAGGVVDRSDLRRVLLRTHATMAALAVGLSTLTFSGHVELWMVWVFAASLGIVETFDNPARHKLISHLVVRADVANAVALNSAGHNMGRLVGPAVAGLVIGSGGVAVAFLVNAFSFLPMFLVLWVLTVPPRPRDRDHSTGTTPSGALRYVLSQPTVRRSLVLTLVVSIFARNFRVLLPLLVVERFDGGAGMYGVLFGCMGVGALFGGVGAARAGTPSIRRLLIAAAWFGGLVLLLPPSAHVLQLGAVLVIVGGSNTFFNVTARSLELLAADEDYRARVMSLHHVVFVGTTPIGALLLGWIVEVGSVTFGFVIAGAVILAAVTAFTVMGHGSRSDAEVDV